MPDYVTQLAAINTAIEDLLSGRMQSYTFAGRTVARLDIRVLFDERKRLEPLAARQQQTGGGIRHRQGVVFRD